MRNIGDLGYTDNPEHYREFVEFFSQQLRGINRLSLFLYGSTIGDDFCPRRHGFTPYISDLDGILITDDDVVTDKQRLSKVSLYFKEAMEQWPVEFDLCVVDETIGKEGRFLTFDSQFPEEHFPDGKLLVGETSPYQFTYLDNVHKRDSNIAWSLRKMRKGLVKMPYLIANDMEEFEELLRSLLRKRSFKYSFACYDMEEPPEARKLWEIKRPEIYSRCLRHPEEAEQRVRVALTGYEEVIKRILETKEPLWVTREREEVGG